MESHNHPEALEQLRADRVEVAFSPLEETAVELFGLKVNPFKTEIQPRGWMRKGDAPFPNPDFYDTGGSPTDVFYDAGELFIEESEARSGTVLLHELCHFILADRSNTLDKPNWGLDAGNAGEDDETHACMLDFFFGFMSGQYSYRAVCSIIDDYGFSVEEDLAHLPGRPRNGSFRIPPKELSNFLYRCAKEVGKTRLGRKLAKKLGIDLTKVAIRSKCENES